MMEAICWVNHKGARHVCRIIQVHGNGYDVMPYKNGLPSGRIITVHRKDLTNISEPAIRAIYGLEGSYVEIKG